MYLPCLLNSGLRYTASIIASKYILLLLMFWGQGACNKQPYIEPDSGRSRMKNSPPCSNAQVTASSHAKISWVQVNNLIGWQE